VSQGTRVGIGYDIHGVEAGRHLVLGGVSFPGESGLAGHSDADVLIHAIIDALLGAAGLGDIGTHFPDNDERWDGASSLDLLRATASMLKDAGATVGNVDATVIAETPRLTGRITDMKGAIGGALGIPEAQVSVKATSNEGLGPVGRGEGIAAMAVALVTDSP